jgi:hypothetical protein
MRDLLLMAKGLSIKPVPAAKHGNKKTDQQETGFIAMSRALPMRKPAARTAANASVSRLIDLLASNDGGEEKTSRARSRPVTPVQSGNGVSRAHRPGLQIELPAMVRTRFEGGIGFIRARTICGWAIDNDEPHRHLVIEAVCNGRVIDRALACGIPTAHGASQKLASHGFVLRLSRNLLPRWTTGRPQVFDLRIAGTDRHLARGVKAFASSPLMPVAGFEGFCGPSLDGTLRGWTWQRHDPEERLTVAVFVDNQFVGAVRAEDYRRDLVAHGIGDGEYGFRFQLSEAFFDGKERRVDVLTAESGVRLRGAPLVLKGRRLYIAQDPGQSRWLAPLRQLAARRG